MSGHPRAGQDTHFVEKFLNAMNVDYTNANYLELLNTLNPDYNCNDFFHSLKENVFTSKYHTCRGGNHFKTGDLISIRVWSGAAYKSKQIKLLPDIAVTNTYDLYMNKKCQAYINRKTVADITLLANNDGLSVQDFKDWFNSKKIMIGQIISWTNKIKY